MFQPGATRLLPLQQDVFPVALAVVAGMKLLPAQHLSKTSSCAVLALRIALPSLCMNTCHEEAQTYDHRASHPGLRERGHCRALRVAHPRACYLRGTNFDLPEA